MGPPGVGRRRGAVVREERVSPDKRRHPLQGGKSSAHCHSPRARPEARGGPPPPPPQFPPSIQAPFGSCLRHKALPHVPVGLAAASERLEQEHSLCPVFSPRFSRCLAGPLTTGLGRAARGTARPGPGSLEAKSDRLTGLQHHDLKVIPHTGLRRMKQVWVVFPEHLIG